MAIWKDEIIDVLSKLGGKATLKEIYKKVEQESSKELSPSYQATVRATLERHSSDSDAFEGKEDLFYIVSEKGKGEWGLR